MKNDGEFRVVRVTANCCLIINSNQLWVVVKRPKQWAKYANVLKSAIWKDKNKIDRLAAGWIASDELFRLGLLPVSVFCFLSIVDVLWLASSIEVTWLLFGFECVSESVWQRKGKTEINKNLKLGVSMMKWRWMVNGESQLVEKWEISKIVMSWGGLLKYYHRKNFFMYER